MNSKILTLEERVQLLELKFDSLDYFFTCMQMEDDVALMEDPNLDNLLRQLSCLNSLRDKGGKI